MPEDRHWDALHRRLRAQGASPRQARRLIEEFRDHLDDLREAGRERGMDPEEAERWAWSRLGDPETLGEAWAAARREAGWAERHPAAVFLALPAPLFFVASLGAYALACRVLASWVSEPAVLAHWPFWSGLLRGVDVAALWIAPAVFCRWSFAATGRARWAAGSCAALAAQALFHRVRVAPPPDGSVAWGYGTGELNWTGALAPLVVFLIFWALNQSGRRVWEHNPEKGMI